MLFWLLIFLSTTDCWAQSDGLNQACGIINSLPCDQVSQDPVCGSNGQFYPSECDFAKAQCKDVSLKAETDPSKCLTTTTAMPNTANTTMSPIITTAMMVNGTTTPMIWNGTTIDTMVNATTTVMVVNGTTIDTMVNGTTPSMMVNGTTTTSTMVNVTTPSMMVNGTTNGDIFGNGTTTAAMGNNTTVQTTTMIFTSAPTQTTPAATTNPTPTPTDALSALCKIVVANPCPTPTPDDSPICATGTVEFPSLCAFTHAQCYDSNLSVVHGGPCSLTTRQPTLDEIICEAIVSNPCNDDGVVLCGSDGITYSNSCEFEKEKCVNQKLQIANQGKC